MMLCYYCDSRGGQNPVIDLCLKASSASVKVDIMFQQFFFFTCKHKGTPVETQREFHANFETYQRDMAKSEYLSLMLTSAELENPQGL